MPNFVTSAALVETATKCLATAASSLQTCQRPVARGVRVGHGLERGEGLGGDDEQGLRGIEVDHRLGEVGAVDVGDKAKDHLAVAVVFERFVGHDRAEVGASDADVDDVANALAGVAFPVSAADAVGESGHLVEHGVDAGNYILAVDNDGLALRRTQGDVQDRPLFGDVDLFSAKHGVDALPQAGFLGKLEEELARFLGDAVLGVVEKKAGRLDGKAGSTLGIVGKQRAQRDVPNFFVMRLERLPGCSLGERLHLHCGCHCFAPFP